MEITVYIRADTLHLETFPSDKRKAEIRQYNNDLDGLKMLQKQLNRVIIEEAKKFHVFHSEVHVV